MGVDLGNSFRWASRFAILSTSLCDSVEFCCVLGFESPATCLTVILQVMSRRAWIGVSRHTRLSIDHVKQENEQRVDGVWPGAENSQGGRGRLEYQISLEDVSLRVLFHHLQVHCTIDMDVDFSAEDGI